MWHPEGGKQSDEGTKHCAQYCSQCGKQLVDGSFICIFCGTHMEEMEETQQVDSPVLQEEEKKLDDSLLQKTTSTQTDTEKKLWKIGNVFIKLGVIGFIIGISGMILTFLVGLFGEFDIEELFPFYTIFGIFLSISTLYLTGLLFKGLSELLSNTRKNNEILKSEKE